MRKSNISNTYYIGHIKCATNNAMMQEIAELLEYYEYTMLHANVKEFFGIIKADIDNICSLHKRCKPVELKMSIGQYCVTFYATRGQDQEIVHFPLYEVLKEIEY